MKTFELSRDMVNMSGQFYPTGHIVLMLPDADAAQAAGRALVDAGIADDDISLITPEAMMRDIVRTVGDSGTTLPSAGTEADTVRRYAQYASQGHYGLLVRAPDNDDSERVMQALKNHPVSHAQKYRMLVIEDLA
ncbi:MAG: hypothetical protein ACXWC6_04390 [Ramlibacter sp.]